MTNALIALILSGAHPCLQIEPGHIVKVGENSTYYAELSEYDKINKKWKQNNYLKMVSLFEEKWVEVPCP